MGRVVVVNFSSIDGVVQGPLSADEDRDGGFDAGGWVPPHSDATVDDVMQEATVGAAGLLLGRRSYDILHAAWSGADESDAAVAAMNAMPKHVVTSGGGDLPWQNSRAVPGGDLATGVARARDGVEGDLVVLGSGTLVRGLAALDLVDEYRVLLFPVVLGAGKRMFDEHGLTARFTLSDSVITGSGVAVLTWTRVRSTGSAAGSGT